MVRVLVFSGSSSPVLAPLLARAEYVLVVPASPPAAVVTEDTFPSAVCVFATAAAIRALPAGVKEKAQEMPDWTAQDRSLEDRWSEFKPKVARAEEAKGGFASSAAEGFFEVIGQTIVNGLVFGIASIFS